jgi:hypothetical protein
MEVMLPTFLNSEVRVDRGEWLESRSSRSKHTHYPYCSTLIVSVGLDMVAKSLPLPR